MKIEIKNLANIIAGLGGTGGVVGIVLTALHIGAVSSTTNTVLLAISGVLTAIAAHHGTSVVAAKAKVVNAAAVGVKAPLGTV